MSDFGEATGMQQMNQNLMNLSQNLSMQGQQIQHQMNNPMMNQYMGMHHQNIGMIGNNQINIPFGNQMGQIGQNQMSQNFGMNNNSIIGQLGNYMMNNIQQTENQGMTGINFMMNQLNLSEKMAEVEFQYNGISTVIQCQEEQKMADICNIFIKKSNIDENNINYFYDGKGGTQFDKSLSFKQMANSLDKQRKKMNILVIGNETMHENKATIISKNIICPQCGEDIKIKINNYKISLFGCKNNHYIYNIPLNEFESTQIINLEKIKCDICNEKNKFNTYKNEFFKCYECHKNICPLCKENHNKNHMIYNYDKYYYKCGKLNEIYIHYCNDCAKNICTLCENEHYNHNIILLSQIMPNKKELLIKMEDLKISINGLNENINKIIEKLNVVKINLNDYYKLVEKIINNYDLKKRNYEILYNINEIINYNIDISQDLYQINSNENIQNKFFNIINIYNKMINSENNMVNQQIMQNPMMQMGQLGQINGMNNNIPMIGQLGNYMMNNMQQMNNQNINRGMVGMNPMINQMNSRMENGPMTNNNLGMMGNQKAQSHNEKSSNSQDSDSQFKSSPIPKNNMQSNKPEWEIIFKVVNGPPYKLKCTRDDKVSDIIEKYRNKSGDKEKRLFIFNAKNLNPDLTVVEAGITNNSNIFVVPKIKNNCCF